MAFTLVETNTDIVVKGRSYDIQDTNSTVVARILWPGIGPEEYGLFLPAISVDDGGPCFRRRDEPGAPPIRGTQYATAEAAFQAFLDLE